MMLANSKDPDQAKQMTRMVWIVVVCILGNCYNPCHAE